MNPTRLRNLPANTGAVGVWPASSNAFTQSTIECGKLDKMAFDEGGRDARDPSIGRLFKRRGWGSERCASILGLLLLAGAVVVCVLLLPFEALGRVGGGQSYGGGGSHGGGSGGSGDAGAIIGIVRILFWLTVEYPVVGVPVDIAVVGFGVYRFAGGGKKTAEAFSSGSLTLSGTSTGVMAFPLGLDDAPRRVDDFNREFAQLRKFDPNFSEIVFTDFCYALYG